MSTAYKGVNATNLAGSIPKLAEEGQQAGIRKTLYDTYVLTTDLAAGDSIAMGGLLPAGAMIVGAEVATGALGGSCTLDVGWDASADAVEAQNKTALFAQVAVSSAGVKGMSDSAATPGTIGYVLQSPVQPKVWEHAVSSGGTGKAITLMIHYLET